MASVSTLSLAHWASVAGTARDLLQGGPGIDWFLVGADDKITGKHKGDQVN
jgi:hypothetical protein